MMLAWSMKSVQQHGWVINMIMHVIQRHFYRTLTVQQHLCKLYLEACSPGSVTCVLCAPPASAAAPLDTLDTTSQTSNIYSWV